MLVGHDACVLVAHGAYMLVAHDAYMLVAHDAHGRGRLYLSKNKKTLILSDSQNRSARV